MAISEKEVNYIAQLARLSLTDDETHTYLKQLNDILLYMAKLDELDTSKVEPTCHVLGLENVHREDEEFPSLSKEEALLNSPDKNDSFYKVPKIIE
ncbi:MAG: Asp-tRNA(Asn)/Glu-tRNA(Gln) amidotransferase subunit GatC [Candidatus Magnetoovum sp. WYHC-5]|nr:Asp-tRNA(Asn)/Glu-tRNA(Gln) amidotransferase subunit GatC [Candidatus Magnetoovum sp. WYHC-5]